ncbi:MAG: hypothetical protein JSR86_21395, partial [Proteobacteria bacterium]|nr:hypothetical protein [Pseudomonadota bacterium]
MAAAVMGGTLALLVLGLQPLLYGAYVAEGVVSAPRLGLLGAVELAGIAGGSALAIHLLSRLRAQILAVAAILLLVAGNAVHPQTGQWGLLFLARLIAGAGAGVLVGLAAGAIARTSRMGAWTGAFLFGQALSQFVLMRALMSFSQDISSYTVQLSLAASALPVLALLPFLPRAA